MNSTEILTITSDKKCARCEKIISANKYCSEECCKLSAKERYIKRYKYKEFDLSREHNRKVDILNKIVNGEIIANKHCKNEANPDVITPGHSFELELYGHNTVKNKSRWYKNHNKRKILVISIRDELKSLFDEIYVLDEEILPIKSFNQNLLLKGGVQS